MKQACNSKAEQEKNNYKLKKFLLFKWDIIKEKRKTWEKEAFERNR